MKSLFQFAALGLVAGMFFPFPARAMSAEHDNNSRLSAHVRNPKLSKDVDEADPSSLIKVIVQYRKDPGTAEEDKLRAHGATLKSTLHSIHSHAAMITRSELDALVADSNVAYISIDRPVATRDSSSPSDAPICITTTEYTTEPINAPAAWKQGYIGTGIAVAVIDSGIHNVPDLNAAPGAPGQRILYQQSFVSQIPGGYKSSPAPNKSQALQSCPAAPPTPSGVQNLSAGSILWPAKGTYPQPPQAPAVPSTSTVSGQEPVQYTNPDDAYGHGTHVAGLIGGNGQKSTGSAFYRTFYGAAPNANLVDLRVLDQSGEGTDSDVIAAIDRPSR